MAFQIGSFVFPVLSAWLLRDYLLHHVSVELWLLVYSPEQLFLTTSFRSLGILVNEEVGRYSNVQICSSQVLGRLRRGPGY